MRTIFPSIHTFAVNIFNSSAKGSICALTQFPNSRYFFSKLRYFFKITLFSKLRYFFQNSVLFKITLFFFKITLFSKLRYFFFQNSVLLKITLFFQNFRVFKKFPVQSSPAIPHKNSMFFQKIPRLENY